MTRRRQRIILVLAALGLLVSAAMIYGGDPPGPDRGDESPAQRRAGDPPAAAAERRGAGPAGAKPAGDRLHTFRRGARTPVPKLVAAVAQAPAFDAGPGRHPRRLERRGDGPTDKRPGPPRADAEALKRALFQRLDQALAAAQSCLDAWSQQDDSLDAGVMLAFSLDDRGLQQVWIQDREGVPDGPLACIASSVYPVDWAGLTREPVEVTVPIKYEPRDAG